MQELRVRIVPVLWHAARDRQSMSLLLTDVASTTSADSSELIDDLTMVGRYLHFKCYSFTTVTPTTHARVVARAGSSGGTTLRDIFGWNVPFPDDVLPRCIFERMLTHGLVVAHDGLFRSTVRFASIEGQLYAHDAYPTLATDSVFFGPDTYRFTTAIHTCLRPCDLLVDVCCGGGAGGLEAGIAIAQRVVLADINPRALAFAEVNRRLVGNSAAFLHHADLLAGIDERPDAIIANPPYLVDSSARAYRNGSGLLGTGLALRIVDEAIALLAPGGQLLLYTGSPIVDGIDRFAAAALPVAAAAGCAIEYEEIDPDVFGEELENPAYAVVDRIAAVILSLTMPRR